MSRRSSRRRRRSSSKFKKNISKLKPYLTKRNARILAGVFRDVVGTVSPLAKMVRKR